MTSSTERPEGVDAALPMRTKSGHRYLFMLVIVFVAALTTLGACSPNDSTAVPEAAFTAEIDQLLDDYYAAWNTYDADALRPLLTDGFMWHVTNPDLPHGISTGLWFSAGVADTLRYAEESAQLKKLHLEWVGEPIITGDGPWLVARAWYYTSVNYEHTELQGISTFSIVDEDGTLKLAREMEVGFDVE